MGDGAAWIGRNRNNYLLPSAAPESTGLLRGGTSTTLGEFINRYLGRGDAMSHSTLWSFDQARMAFEVSLVPLSERSLRVCRAIRSASSALERGDDRRSRCPGIAARHSRVASWTMLSTRTPFRKRTCRHARTDPGQREGSARWSLDFVRDQKQMIQWNISPPND